MGELPQIKSYLRNAGDTPSAAWWRQADGLRLFAFTA
jgi:hypothetical protein